MAITSRETTLLNMSDICRNVSNELSKNKRKQIRSQDLPRDSEIDLRSMLLGLKSSTLLVITRYEIFIITSNMRTAPKRC